MEQNGANELREKVCRLIQVECGSYWDYFELQRRQWGRAHAKLSEVSNFSHEVFHQLGLGNVSEAEIEFSYCQKAFGELTGEDFSLIPTHKKWELESAGGQELNEGALGISFYPVLIGKKDPSDVKLFSADELGITKQSWISGAIDFTSECSKLVDEIFYEQVVKTRKLDISRRELRMNSIEITKGMRIALRQFNLMYPVILNVSNRPGQGFNKKRRLISAVNDIGVRNFNDMVSPCGEPPEVEESVLQETDPDQIAAEGI
jgi:predicted translin family RNA/ssDNA-binding protein